ncbi:MAG: 5'/3'-nucleotidase SurE [Gammaproteobacteria bacterium]
MHILISNDDGYLAEGLSTLVNSLTQLAKLTVVVPDRDYSGASNSLTLDNPIRAVEMENGFIKVNGTPTDCVHLAITGLLPDEPDMVVSGINAGSNLGDDVLYSGTVAAAMEGRYLGLPAIAVSLAGNAPTHFQTAGKVIVKLIDQLKKHPLPADTILSINVPDVPYDQIKGIMSTRLGHRHKSEPVIKESDPRGRPVYWVGPAGAEQDAGPGTDFYAIKNNFVSVTPLQIDLTRYSAIEMLGSWLGEIGV